MEQTLALLLTGLVAVPILQVVKRYTGLKDVPMVWIAFLTSILLSIVTLTILGKLDGILADPFQMVGSGSIVMTLATLVYRTLKEKLKL